MKAIILAGGLGTRLKPLTDKIPKPMIPIQHKPLIEWAILNLKKHGINEIILSLGYLAEKLQNHFKDGSHLGVNITYNIEREPLGTGGAVKDICEKQNIQEPFILAWGDNLADFNWTEIIECYKKNNADLVMALTEREDVENFGVAKLDDSKIIGFVEKPERGNAPSNLINCGGFIVNPIAIRILPNGKSSIERDCFEKLCGKDGFVYAYRHTGYWFPTDTPEQYEKAKQAKLT